jgi:hypothetical protein
MFYRTTTGWGHSGVSCVKYGLTKVKNTLSEICWNIPLLFCFIVTSYVRNVCLTTNTIINLLALYLRLVYFLQHLYRCKQVGCTRAYSTEHELHLHEVICRKGKSMCCILNELFDRFYGVSVIMKV